MDQIKLEFADQFTKCLRAYYKDRLPSFAKIARDFSLRAPHLPHVSAETVRHWARGASLPHVSRMQVLVDWLGPEVASSFDKNASASLSAKPLHNSDRLGSSLIYVEKHRMSLNEDADSSELINILNILNEEERRAIFEIAQLFVARHRPLGLGDGHLYDTSGNSEDSSNQESEA